MFTLLCSRINDRIIFVSVRVKFSCGRLNFSATYPNVLCFVDITKISRRNFITIVRRALSFTLFEYGKLHLKRAENDCCRGAQSMTTTYTACTYYYCRSHHYLSVCNVYFYVKICSRFQLVTKHVLQFIYCFLYPRPRPSLRFCTGNNEQMKFPIEFCVVGPKRGHC